MGIARSICIMNKGALVVIVLACVVVSVMSVVWGVFPRLENGMIALVAKYDAIFPEITIRNGHASIREKQPHFLDSFDQKDLLVVMDTRPESQNEAMNYLKGAKVGAVLTARTIIIKNDQEVRIVPLQDLPDMVLNSQNIRSSLEEFIPRITLWATILVVIYFTMAKSVQVFIMALLPFWGSQFYGEPLPYVQAIRMAAAGMIVPVCVDFVAVFLGIGIFSRIFIYFMVYIGVLILATITLLRDAQSVSNQGFGIHPS